VDRAQAVRLFARQVAEAGRGAGVAAGRGARHITERLGRRGRAVATSVIAVVVALASAGALVLTNAALATTTMPLLGLWVNGQNPQQLGVTAQVVSDYAGGSDYCSYPSVTSGLGSGQTLMLAVGACSESEAESMATTLKDAGQSEPIIRIMWEFNQNYSGWFSDWNQGTFPTAASYDAAFDTVAAGFRAVFPNALIVFNPNQGDNHSGQTY